MGERRDRYGEGWKSTRAAIPGGLDILRRYLDSIETLPTSELITCGASSLTDAANALVHFPHRRGIYQPVAKERGNVAASCLAS